ncbi:MAG: 3-oxoacyl-[acyl-carrier-protein] synthase 3 [Chitinophagales bacterium]|nr:MAG: 3-oxoacyl-[acyl-carrier-protein] synthase 3 [Chitinophagales bacterium]
MSQIRAAISAISGYVPDDVLTNADLEKMVDTHDEWITTRTGIRERRILKDKEMGSSFMAEQAVLKLLQDTGTDPAEIDLLICATVTPDFPLPATANIISEKTGIKNAFSFDLAAACSGFLYALITAAQFIESGRCRKIIVVGADKMSSIVNYEDRETCVLFGDGAGAALLEPSPKYGIEDFILKADGSGCRHLYVKAGGSVKPASHETVDAREHFVYQEGKAVFKFAVVNMADACEELMKRNGLTANDIDWLVPHQANKRIIEATRTRIGLPEEKVMINIHKYGNTTAATIPLCLWEWENKLHRGDKLILTAVGGGYTWGAIYMTWAY